MAKISDTELQSIINGEISNSLGFLGGNLSSQRKKSLEYYLGEKLGTEIDGRSQVVSTDVADTIETILPNLLRIFTASDNVVRCEPVKAEDVALAEQATNYINYIFNKDNPGFSILYTWFKDALLEKNGIVKVFWDESQKVGQETYKNLDDNEYQLLVNDPNVEFVETEEFEDENAKEQLQQVKEMAAAQGQEVETPIPMLHNCIIKRSNAFGKVKVENVPPEEFLISRSAKSIEDANFVAHKVARTRSELIEMGFDPEVVDSLPATQNVLHSTEKLTRFGDIDENPFKHSTDKSTEQIELYECYIKIDYDGDGVAELRKVCVGGNSSYTILENVSVDSNPFCSLTPIPMPHRFYGRSVSELVEDIQLVKSTVMRQLLDNMYLTNNNRVAIMDGMVNLDDLLTSRPGGVVRTKQPPSQVMMPMQSQTISQQAFPLLEYLDTVRETRTGVTRYAQGLDADSLNKTATGINTLMTQTQMRMELIARIFSETGVKDLFSKIFELTVKYQDKERIVQLNNQFVPVRPTEWKDRYNISIIVGLGSGSKEQQLVILNNILERQVQAFQLQGGQEYPMVTLKNFYNTLSKMIENAGLKNVENYFVNPDVGKQMVQPKPPPPPTPIEKIEFTRIASEEKRKLAELELENKKIRAETAEAILGFEAKIKDMELKYNTQIDVAKMKADADLDKLVTSNRNKTFLAAQKSSDTLEQQINSLDEQRRTSKTEPGSEPVQQG
tara:strand:- start:2249 stop:4435 length:2187 start_codon:yes stop_codon:yes gene_type:complete